MEIKIKSIQEAIDLAAREKITVVMPCSLSGQEIRAAIKDNRACHVFRHGEGMIRIVPVEYIDTLGCGPHVPTISVGARDKARQHQA